MTHLLLGLLLACSGDTGTDSADPETGTPDTGDTGDTGEDTGPTDGRYFIEGEATVIDSWIGTESLMLKGDLGLGQVDCHVRMPVISTGTAKGCENCVYAWDVVIGTPEVVIDNDCAAAGWDAAAIAALEGTTRSYGIAIEYVGHSDVLLLEDEGSWGVVAYVDWTPSTGTISYTWDLGYATY